MAVQKRGGKLQRGKKHGAKQRLTNQANPLSWGKKQNAPFPRSNEAQTPSFLRLAETVPRGRRARKEEAADQRKRKQKGGREEQRKGEWREGKKRLIFFFRSLRRANEPSSLLPYDLFRRSTRKKNASQSERERERNVFSPLPLWLPPTTSSQFPLLSRSPWRTSTWRRRQA